MRDDHGARVSGQSPDTRQGGDSIPGALASFSVIVPSTARPTLSDTLASIARQLEPGDELLVICNSDGDFGNAARNSGIDRARGSHLVFLDDDDEWLPDALTRMRRFADENPGRVGIFRFRTEFGELPVTPDLRTAGSPTYVVPNTPGKVGRFGPTDITAPGFRKPRPGETPESLAQRFGDYEFIRATMALRGDEPIWVPEVTTVLRPEKKPWRRLRYQSRLRTRVRALAGSALARSRRFSAGR